MKPLTTIIAFLLLSPICFSQQVEIATTLSPEDLGAYKWILSGTAPENSVVIFRETTIREWPDGEVISTNIIDSVYYDPGKKRIGTAFFIDPHRFEPKGEEPKWYFQSLGGSGWIEGQYAGHSHGGRNEISFQSEKLGKVKTKMVFETFIKPYDEAALLYDGFPTISAGISWGWRGFPKKQSEQGGADQPATAPESKSEGSDKPQSEKEVAPR
jgi:hypothetical protein